MDPDGADGGTVVTDSLNGETKPDPAKLAQSAIIKQVSRTYGHIWFIPVDEYACRPRSSQKSLSIILTDKISKLPQQFQLEKYLNHYSSLWYISIFPRFVGKTDVKIEAS